MSHFRIRSEDFVLQERLPKAGSISIVDLNPVVGHEQWGHRPCVTVSVPTMHETSEFVFGIASVVPRTKQEKNWWTVVPIPKQEGLRMKSYALCHQIRAVSTNRITDIPGFVRKKDLNKIRLVLSNMLSMP